ncbi:hypothetical protein LTR95_005722 [Oleoguttula sp. CCFEE 5521]
MATVTGLTKKQNGALAGLDVGYLVIIYQDEVLYDSHGNMTEYDSDAEPVNMDGDDGDSSNHYHEEESENDSNDENGDNDRDVQSVHNIDESDAGEVSGSEEGADGEHEELVLGSVNTSTQTDQSMPGAFPILQDVMGVAAPSTATPTLATTARTLAGRPRRVSAPLPIPPRAVRVVMNRGISEGPGPNGTVPAPTLVVGALPASVFLKANDNNTADDIDPNADLVEPQLYIITSVNKDGNGTVNDAKLVKLLHRTAEGAASSPSFTYDVFGDQVTHNVPAWVLTGMSTSGLSSQSNVIMVPITTLLPTKHFVITPRPNPALVREYMFSGECPFNCNGGYLASLADLVGKIPGYTSTATRERPPVCPSCIGVPLCQEQQRLYSILEQFLAVDLGLVVEWLGRLNIQRRKLGYGFIQFDEREWGYLFDDMASDDGEDDGGDNGQYEQWDEAMDPNAGGITRPASKATIEALPRVPHATLKGGQAGTECLVCRDAFMDDTVLVQLPCGHCFCEGGCVEQWLRQWDTCPTCRRQVAPIVEKKEDVTVQGQEVEQEVAAVDTSLVEW